MELINLLEGLLVSEGLEVREVCRVLLPLRHEAEGGSGQEAGLQPPLLYHHFSRFAAVQVKTAWLLLSSRKPVLGTRPSITRQLESSWGCMVVKNMDRRTSCSASGLWSGFVISAQKPALPWSQSAASQKAKVPGLLSAIGMFKTGAFFVCPGQWLIQVTFVARRSCPFSCWGTPVAALLE